MTRKNKTTGYTTNFSSVSQTIDQLNTQLKPAFDSIKSAWQDIFTEDGGFTLENVDLSMLASIKSAIDELNSTEGADISIGYSSFENLARVLTDTSSTADDVKSSMNALATDILNSLNPALSSCSGEQYLFLKSMLETVGIINSEEVLISSLGYSYDEYTAAKNEAAIAGFDLANATESEINSFVMEAIESGTCGEALARLQLKKMLVNSTSIDTASDIQAIMNLASAADVSDDVLNTLAGAKNILSQVEAGNPISLASYEKALSDVEKARLDILDWKPVEIDFTTTSDTKPVSAPTSAESAAEEAEKAAKNYIDSYLDYMESSLDAGIIDYQNYARDVSSFLKGMYDDGRIAAQDYFNYQGQMLETQLSVYDKAISAVTRLIDREIDGIQNIIDSIEEQNDSLNAQLDDYDKILSVVDSVYQKEIDSLNEQKDLLQDKIDAINDANDSLDLQYRREQALYELKRSQEQLTGKVFNGTEFVYTADQNSVKEAQDSLQDIETEEIIRKLEAEQEQLEASAESLERYRDLWADISDAYDDETNTQLAVSMWGKDYEQLILSNRLSDIDSFKNDYISIQDKINDNQGLIDSYNEKIEYYEALKEQWSSISDAYGQAQENQYAAMLLGQNWEAEVLSGRLSTLNDFRNEYVSIQQAIADAAWNSANEQIRAAQEAKKGASGSSGGAGSVGADDKDNPKPPKPETPTKYKVVDESGNTLAGFVGDDAKSKAEKYKNTLDDAVHDPDNVKIVPYASGTAHARRGLNLVGEDGAETYIDNAGNVSLVTKPSLIPMAGGETVMNASETASLLDPDNLIPADIRTPDDVITFPVPNGHSVQLSMEEMMQRIPKVMPDYLSMVQPAVQLPEYDFSPANIGSSTNISIGDIHLHEVQNVDSLANAIIRDLPNKALQAMHRRK